MPQAIQEYSATYAPAHGEEKKAQVRSQQAVPITASEVNGHTNWPIVMLAAGGSGAGAAFLGGLSGNPIVAIGAGVVGVVIGVWVQKSHKSVS